MSCSGATRRACVSPRASRCCAAGTRSWCASRAERSARTPPDRPRVAIEGAAAARERLEQLLGDDVDLTPQESADVVLFDAAGARELSAALARGFADATILLVDDPHAGDTFAALRAGASAVLARSSDARELLAAIEAVRVGLVVVDANARELRGSGLAVAATAQLESLTEREREVLGMLGRGWSNHRIAAQLAISDNTVKAHVASILAKLGARTRTEAVTIGIRLGLVML